MLYLSETPACQTAGKKDNILNRIKCRILKKPERYLRKMKTNKLSLLFPDQDRVEYRMIPEETWHDLGLDTLVEKLTAQPQEQMMIAQVMRGMTPDPAVTAFRCGVFEDILRHPEIREKMAKLLERVKTFYDYGVVRRHEGDESGIWDLMHRLEEYHDYIITVEQIRECLAEKDLQSEGMLRLREAVETICRDNGFAALRRDVECMLHFPGDFGCFDLFDCTVDKQSTISIKGSHYSVPDHLVGTNVIVQLYSEKVRVYDADHKKMAEHERSYSHGSWTFDINHYINTLMKKPGALKGSVALRQMPEKMQELFRVHFAENGKDFLKLLKYCRDNNYDYKDILDAVKKIRMRGARHINFDQIKVALETRDAAPLVFTDKQKTDEFIEIELGSEDVLSQLDGIMQGTAAERRCGQ